MFYCINNFIELFEKYKYLHLYYYIDEIIVGIAPESRIPENIPVINIAAANIPAVTWYFPWTHCGAYIIPSEL